MTPRKTYPHNQSALYKITRRKKLADEIFHTELAFLERLARNGDSNYRVFHVVQGTKKRQVEVPKPILERLHRRLFALLERLEKPAYLHSGVKGRSYITNARVHLGHTPLVKLDIKKFYPSVTTGRVFRLYRVMLQCSPDVSALLTKLCTFDGHVPTGSCLSQLLAFFAARPMFDELHQMAIEYEVKYSCYVDDLTFSGLRATPALLWTAKQIVFSHGFAYHKDRCYAADQRKLVTGVLLDGNRAVVLPSRERQLWRDLNALAGTDPRERLAAIDRLIGQTVAASQVEARFLNRFRRLRRERADTLAQIQGAKN